MKNPRYRRASLEYFIRGGLLLGALFLALVASGCASILSLDVRCDQRINDGLLLTIDIVLVAEDEVQEIRELGDQWFYSPLRRRLGSRTKTVAVEGGCAETVHITPQKGYDVLAVIADYQFEGGPRQTKGQVEFIPKQQWSGKRLPVRVRDTFLNIQGGR